MPDNVVSTEVVEFKAAGLDDLVKGTGDLQASIKQAHAALAAQQAAYADPAYRRAAADLAKVRAAADAATRAERDRLAVAAQRGRLASGEALTESRRAAAGLLAADRLTLAHRRQVLQSGLFLRAAAGRAALARDEGRLARDERRAVLGSGLYARGVADRLAGGREDAQLARAERRVELQVTHGRLLGGALATAERLAPAAAAAGAVGGVGLAMGRAGFGGTVEGNVFAMELRLLNREIAGALVPVMREVTGAVTWLRQKLEGLSGKQQRMLGYGIAGAAALGSLGLLAGGVKALLGGLGGIGLGGLLGGGGRLGSGGARRPGTAAAERRRARQGGALSPVAPPVVAGGSGRLLTGLAGAGALGYGMATSDVLSGGIGGGALGGVLGGAAGSGLTALTAGSRLAGLAGVGRLLGPVGAVAGTLVGAMASSDPVYRGEREGDYYDRMRAAGHGRIMSGLRTAAAGWGSVLGITPVVDRPAGGVPGTPGAGRTSPLIADAGFETFDSAYERVATSVALSDASGAGRAAGGAAGGALGSDEEARLIRRAIEEILEEIRRRGGPTPIR